MLGKVKMQNAKTKMQKLKFDIRHSIFNIRYSIILLLSCLFLPTILFAQLSAGPDVTINPGVPVTLTAKYGEDLIATPVEMKDDEAKGPFKIDSAGDFNFVFYGKTYNTFSICSNGWISFTYNPAWAGQRDAILIPSFADLSPKNCILGPMQDYDASLAQSPYIYYRTIGTKPNRKLIVMWCQIPIRFCETDISTFQIVLNEADSTIESHISSKPLCTDPGNKKATLGIQNETGYKGLAITGYNQSAFAITQKSWKYTPVPKVLDEYTYNSIPPPFELIPITPPDKISYSWYEGTSNEPFSTDKSIVVTPNETTVYTVICNICSGATFSSTVTVKVVSPIPNAFNPNSTIPANTKFFIKGLPAGSITRYNIKIYNRWGQMVFTSTETSIKRKSPTKDQ